MKFGPDIFVFLPFDAVLDSKLKRGTSASNGLNYWLCLKRSNFLVPFHKARPLIIATLNSLY